MSESEKCELCGSNEKLTKHHLVPKLKCKGKLAGIKENSSNIIMICDMCHRTIHAYFNENELRDNLNSVEKLIENEKFELYLDWRKKHMKFKSKSTKLSR